MNATQMDAATAGIVSWAKTLLGIDSPTGYTARAADWLMQQLRALGFSPETTVKGSVRVLLGGEGEPVVLGAHVDTLGAMVAEVKSSGRLRVTPLGGLNANNVETENCRVYTRGGRVYTGTFQLCNASIHVNPEYAETKRSFDTLEVLLDEPVDSAEQTRALGIEIGDIVCAEPRTILTDSGYFKSRFIDDKMSAAVLLGVARAVADGKLRLGRKTYLAFTVYEEVGHGCAGIVPPDAAEVLSVDMGCVGNGLQCTERQVSICAKDSAGPYNYTVTSKLIRLAQENGIPYAVDIYPRYGSDADAALSAGYEVRHGLIGQGVYASHGYERTHIEGIKATYDLLCAYLQAGPGEEGEAQ